MNFNEQTSTSSPKGMEQSWRWFGSHDPVSLSDAKQAGVTGIVSALHHIPVRKVWEREGILNKKQAIEKRGVCWSVAENIPVHENIKARSSDYQKYLENYKQSVRKIYLRK